MGLQRVGHDWASSTPNLGLCSYTDWILVLVKCWFPLHTVLSRTSIPFKRGDVKGRNVWGNSVNGDNIWTWYTSSMKELHFLLFSLGFNLLLLFCLICFRRHRYLFTCFSAVWLFLSPLLLLANVEHSLCSRHSLETFITFFKLSASCLWNSTVIIPILQMR